MTGPGMQADDSRQVLTDAKRLRESISASVETLDPKIIPLLFTRFSQLLDVAEALLAERERFESRLQRSHPISLPEDFNSQARP